MIKNDQAMRTAQRYEEASAWIAKMDKGLSATELRNLCEWLAVDAMNRTLLLELACLWDRMNVLAKLPQELFNRDEENDIVTGQRSD